jgi:hypothetical protein
VVWSARPQLLSLLLTAAVAYVLYLFKWQRVNRLWLLPPLFALWVNLHAGYALGFMVVIAFVAGEVFNHLLEAVIPADDPIIDWQGMGWVIGIGLLSALLLVINPNTTRMWTYYLETVRIDVLQDVIQEWSSPDFHPLHTQPFIWLLLTTMAAMGLSGRRVDGTDLALVSGFAYAALLAGRNMGPFALVTGPVLSRHVTAILSRWQSRSGLLSDSSDNGPRSSAVSRPLYDREMRKRPPTRAQGAINWALLALIVALAALKIYRPLRPAFNEALHRETLPVDAATWIEERKPEGRMFNHYNWGGYLIWRLWPAYRVFVDGRTDLYGNDFLLQYLEAQMARPGFEETLEQYDVNLILMPAESTLSTQVACQEGWKEAYRDEVASIWIRKEVDE